MRRASSVFIAMAALSFVLAGSPASAQGSGQGPTLSSTSRSVEFGDQIAVRGDGWTPNSIVNVAVCGNDANNGSSDCDIVNGRVVGVSSRGTFGVSLVVGQPPAPCPCVVRSESQTSAEVVTFGIEITGAPVLSEDQQFQVPVPDRQLVIDNARIDGRGPWYSYVGGQAKRDVVFTVENIGDVTVRNAAITLSLGKGPNPKGFVKAPDIGELKPGESRTYSVPINLPIFALGTYGVQGQIPGFTDPVRFRAETSHVPWGLVALPFLVLIQVLLIATRNRLRRKIETKTVQVPSRIVPAPLALPPATLEQREDPDIIVLSDVDMPATMASQLIEDHEPSPAAPVARFELSDIADEIATEVRLALSKTSLRSGDSSPDDKTLERIVRDVAQTAAVRIGLQHSLGRERIDELESEIHTSLLRTIGAAARAQPVTS